MPTYDPGTKPACSHIPVMKVLQKFAIEHTCVFSLSAEKKGVFHHYAITHSPLSLRMLARAAAVYLLRCHNMQQEDLARHIADGNTGGSAGDNGLTTISIPKQAPQIWTKI